MRPHAVIVTPAPPGSRAGNRNTATRWSRILRALGWRVTIATAWTGERCELMVALHACRSHEALAAYRDAHPAAPAILALTGTDLYRDIEIDPRARRSLSLADRLIVLQDEGPKALTPGERRRTRVIYQSAVARGQWRPPRRVFRLCVLGHLREEKDPLRAAHALAHLQADRPIELIQAGGSLDDRLAAEARRIMAADSRYRWLEEIPHWRALRVLATSHVMVISSRMEGGAHVVSEAIAQGVPVIASDIAGNRGMLGARYPAYYPVGDERALARQLMAVMNGRQYLEALRTALALRRPLLDPAREAAAWRALLAELGLPALSEDEAA